MHGKAHLHSFEFDVTARAARFALMAIIVVALLLIFVLRAQAQTFNVIHHFTGGLDGGSPYAGLTMDAAGNLFGTTCGTPCVAGASNAGTVFRLARNGSGWLFTTLYVFRGGTDGAGPTGRVILGPDDSLYGSTLLGGSYGLGTVFRLSHVRPSVFSFWTESVLYSFQGSDGAYPQLGNVTFDQAGNLYSTTSAGGPYNAGTVFQLEPSPGGWTETILHAFTGGSDGGEPLAGVVFDNAGNLYGAAFSGGSYSCAYGPCGTLFKLTPSGSGWTETTIYSFQPDWLGGNPIGAPLMDQNDVLATASWGGAYGGGAAFLLNGGLWAVAFTGSSDYSPYPGPWASLTGSFSNLYGTTYSDGTYHRGSAFQLVAGCAGWGYTVLHNFTGGQDGANPISSLLLDPSGNMFGTTSAGGAYGFGVVFEITPAQDLESLQRQSGCSNER
ncbi:MAG: choice-of-anchor tandem repeat GloVer-containing protein [Candidatus Korobacteraceae bacterium]|jgi:uncharacterized repeat protein (TIGR03803 family)